MTSPVRVGIVGTSRWADMLSLPSLKSHPEAALTAICGRSRERAQEMAVKYDVPRVYTDYREMIEQAGLDALVVSTPDDLHHAITMTALEAGLHVLCEKPLASNAAQAREMYETAKARGVKHMVLFTYRWLPHLCYINHLVHDGYVGRPYQAQFSFRGGFARSPQYRWRFDGRRANGVLGDFGSHMLDLARWCLGDIDKVSARLGTFVAREGLEGRLLDPANDAASLLLEFANGAQASVQLSAVAHVAERGMEQSVMIYGDAGTLEAVMYLAGPDEGAVVRGARHDDEAFQTLPVPDAFGGALDLDGVFKRFYEQSIGPRAFIDAILNDQPAVPSFHDGLRAQEMIDAALASHRTGRWVTVSG